MFASIVSCAFTLTRWGLVAEQPQWFQCSRLQDPDQLEGTLSVDERIWGVIINAGPERMLSPTVTRLLSRVGELLPEVPVAVLSDFEDAGSIWEAFNLGVRGYIPTSLASMVAVEAVRMVCVGGTFAPAAALLSQTEAPMIRQASH